jgi:DNA polymerase elongation subunit (family B)
VNAAQLALIKQKLQETPTQPNIVYAEILRRNEDIVQIIIALRENTLNEEQKTALIKAGFARLQESPNKLYQEHANQINQRTCEIIADVHDFSDAKQKKHASHWFGQFEQQLLSLSNSQF